MKWLLMLAALLGAVTTACEGADSPSPDTASGSGGTAATGGTGGNDEVVLPPCPSGMVEKKADNGSGGTVCTVQPSVQGDAAVGDDGAGGSIDPTSDAGSDDASTNPDAGTDECPDLEGLECPRDTCTFHAAEEPCSFNCMNPDGSQALGMVSGAEDINRLATYCGMEL